MGMHMNVDPSLPAEEYKRAAYNRYMRRYFRCVKGVDDNIKRLFDYLETNLGSSLIQFKFRRISAFDIYE